MVEHTCIELLFYLSNYVHAYIERAITIFNRCQCCVSHNLYLSHNLYIPISYPVHSMLPTVHPYTVSSQYPPQNYICSC